MARSMTGYGRAECVTETRKISMEIKSVNNRYADFNIRLPRKFNFLEAKIRSVLKEQILRGKVDIFILTEEYGEEAGSLKYNAALAEEYAQYMRQMISSFGLPGNVTVRDLATAPEVFTIESSEADEEELWSMMKPVAEEAITRFNESRTEEGERLKADLLGKLDELETVVDEVIAHEPEIMDAYRARLLETLTEILEDRSIEESRIIAECAVFADKISTDEESVRLKSHIRQMREELKKSGSIGRKLDFLAQEMNREANTTLSKAGDLITADNGIAMKTIIEKIREQIQNIE